MITEKLTLVDMVNPKCLLPIYPLLLALNE